MNRLFTWLAGLFGVFLMIYGVIIESQTLSRSGLGRRVYEGETYWQSQWHILSRTLRHEQVVHLCMLLILAGLLIVMLTYPRSKPRK